MIKTAKSKTADQVKVSFVLPADTPPVSVVGEFNDWDPYAHPMRKRSNGTRSVTVELPAGESYRFRYLGDGGEWLDEPDTDHAPNDHGSEDNIIIL
jgi:1,4-alpha-glucan branching enzyme